MYRIDCLEVLGLGVGFGSGGVFILHPCDVRGDEGFFCQCAKVFGLALEGFELSFKFECAGMGVGVCCGMGWGVSSGESVANCSRVLYWLVILV